MTRENVINKIFKYASDLGDSLSQSFVERLVNDIYDDFEKQTCENCKHCDEIKDTIIHCESFEQFLPIEMSCNRWEKKCLKR
jgi:hypothetical protein